MAWFRAMGGSAEPGTTKFTDEFSVAPSQTTGKSLGVSPKSGSFAASIRITFSSATTVSSATFNDNYITIGSTNYNLWGNAVSPTSGSLSYIDFVISGAINTADAVAVNIKNTSSALTRTCTIEVVIF